jgi:mono/diheme cytochrome c family protein
MRQSHRIAAVLLCLIPSAACDKSTPNAGTPAKEPVVASAAPASPSAGEGIATPGVAEHMRDHFSHAVKMRDAVIAGDLPALRKDAQWMAEHEISKTLPETWRPHVTRLHDAAKKALDAQDITAAGAAVAETAAACGACHAKLGGPKLALGTPPAEGSGAALHMARHQWAAARMWDALATPSEEAWLKASEVMADAPLLPAAATGPRSVPQDTKKLGQNVHDIAEKARQDRDVAKWTGSYGQFLTTCAACHQALGAKPPAKP